MFILAFMQDSWPTLAQSVAIDKPIMAMNIAKAVGRIGISKNLWNKKYAF